MSIENCRSCHSPKLTDILSLGEIGLSDFVDPNSPKAKKYPLDLKMCGGCTLVQLGHTTPAAELYTDRYGYRSGISGTMVKELSDIVSDSVSRVPVETGDIVLDIGANDGTLLGNYSKGVERVGFEPIREMSRYSNRYTGGKDNIDTLFINFFDAKVFQRCYPDRRAKLVTAISMFYDLDDPNTFLEGVKECLDPKGLLVVQQNYLAKMIVNNAFDNIVHEHLEYYSLGSMEKLLDRHDLKVIDVSQNETNGGSFRTYIGHKDGPFIKDHPSDHPASNRVDSMRQTEQALGLDDPQTYAKFADRVRYTTDTLSKFISGEVSEGKTVYVYGASTRGNTLLQACHFDNRLITAAVERNPAKWDKVMASTGIPIISEEQARMDKPDYFLVLPWFFKDEIVKREDEFRKGGGRLIFPLPHLEII